MAIQPSDVQYGFLKCRGRVEVGRLYDDGFLCLKGDPGVWIQSNPDSLSSVRCLELFLWRYKGERIGDSIGELSQLTHLSIYGGNCNLKCLPNTLSRLYNLHHLELSGCEKLEDLPPNFGDLYNLTYLSLMPCHSLKLIESVAKLSNLTTLFISKLEELPPNLGGLYNLKSLSLYECGNYVIESVTKLSNLTTLIIYGKKLEELPANLGDLKFLASLFLYHCYRLRCLPWSITKLSNLRILYLPEEFRLETLPPHLNDSIIISVAKAHIRKTWKELKTHVTETLSYQFPIIPEELTAQKTSTPGYLQFIGDPTLWIRDYGSHSSLRVLDLDLGVSTLSSCEGKIPDSIAELLPQLTHLYISNGCLPHHLPPTFSRLTHLSLIGCTFECHTISHFDSLGNLSTLTSLHLYQRYNKLLPEHMDLPISLTHLSLDFCYSSFPDSHMASMAKLSNLNTLTLSHCGDLESLPLHLNLTKLILRNTIIKSLPIGLKHLEIIHVICRHGLCKKLQECWRNQLVNLETLSYTCSELKSLLSLTSLHNLRELQLKDCFSLKELPQDLDKLVNLCTLDVSGTRIQSLPSSIINLYNLQCLILPKCFILKSLPDDFGNKVMISVDDTDESYYKHQGYHNRGYGIIKDCDYMTSDSINEINEKFLELFKQATITIIEQASPHRPSNHQPDATRIIEGSQFNGSTDPTSNNNPNAFISSPNHEIENLPISNEAGTIPVVVNECYSDVNANTMHVHVPKKFAAFNTDIPNFPYRNNIPAVIMDYLVGWNDVEADGNCGFRCVAEVFHGGQENWPMARRAILNELKAHPDVYQKIYRDDYDSALQRIDWGSRRCGQDNYMKIVEDLFPIANCYQCPVMCFTMNGLDPHLSATVFPWNVGAHSTKPTKEFTIAHLGIYNKHYILLDLKDDFPVPPISHLWYAIRNETVDWDSQYATKMQRWDRLTNSSRDSTHLDVCDDESYYKHAGYYDSVYELSDDEDSINSNSTEDDTEIVAESRQEAIIEQASPHRPLNHPPDEIQILEDPTTNNNPNAFISSPNHEIENLPISNEAGTRPVVVNEYCSDVNPNTMQDHDPMDIEGNNNAVLQYNNRDGVVTDIAAEPSSKFNETSSSGLSNQQAFLLEQIANFLELERGTSSIGSFKGQDNIYQRGGGVQHKSQKIRGKISLDRINELKSQNLTLEVAASKEHLGDPTSNDNPNAFISSPNHEIKNLPTSNEAGTIPFVVNEYYSDVNANTMQVHVPKKLAAFNTDIPNFPYRNNIPAVIMDYLVGWNDVEADGNCGFRCVAEVFHGGQENWPMARQAILNELKAHPDVYQTIYCDDYDSALQRIDWNDGQCGEDHYMEIVTDLYPIANCYQCPVMCFTMTADGSNPQFSVTVFPWNVAAHSTGPTKEVTIAHLGKCKHYILLDLKDDFPVPPVSTLWNGIKDETVDWDSQYATKRQRWDRLTNRSRDSTHLDVSDDCNVNGGNSVVGENISHGHAYFNKEIEIQTLNSSRKGVVVTSVNLELAIGTAFAPALCKSQNSVKGGSNNHALVIGQHKKSQTGNVKHNNQRIEISRESINTLRSEGLTLEKAAEHFNVSKTTLKRRLKEYKITWKSSKKRKTLYTNSKMMPSKQSGRILSQINLVDPSNPTRQGQMELAGPSQLASTLGQGMEHPIGQKHPTLSDIETIDSKDADPQQLEEIISQFGYIIINKSTEFHTYGHQRVEEPLNGDKAGRNLSGSQLMINLVDPSNPTSHGQGMEHLAEPSQPALFNRAIHGQGVEHLGGPSQPALFNPASHGQGVEHLAGPSQPILSYHVPSERNVVNNLTLDVVTRPDFEVKATYDEDTVCFRFSWSSSFEQLKEEVGKRFELEVGKFKMRYHDEIDWILVTCISDLERALGFSKPPESNVVKLSIALK